MKQVVRQPDLSIVIPAYREENRIGNTLDELAEFLNQNVFFKKKNVEVIIVAADTSDNTHKIVRLKHSLFKQLTLLKPGPHFGKGRDVQYGMLRATGKYAVFMDADLATPLSHLEEFYATCEQEIDIVIGTRDLFHYREEFMRNLFSVLGNWLYRFANGIQVEDTQCGFKMFSHKAAQICFSKLSIMGWGFDLEILAIAKANNLTIAPIRLNDWEDKPYSTYTDGALRISTRMVRDFVRITVNRLRGAYSVDK
jgi:dolichyl-phosphate beta-glucosyltransferase